MIFVTLGAMFAAAVLFVTLGAMFAAAVTFVTLGACNFAAVSVLDCYMFSSLSYNSQSQCRLRINNPSTTF